MEDLVDANNTLIKKIDLLIDGVALIRKYDSIAENVNLNEIKKGLEDVEDLLKTVYRLSDNNVLGQLQEEYDDVMKKMRDQQAEIIKYLLQFKKEQIKMKNTKNSSDSVSAEDQFQKPMANLAIPPVDEYKESPSVRRVRFCTNSIQIKEFKAHISQVQLETIPKYMRGRITLYELQNFLDKILRPCFEEKYKLINRARNVVQHTKEFDLWKLFQSQKSYVPGREFITAGDISRKIEKIIDKKMQNYLIMLKHLRIIQEQRVSKIICYIWTASEF